MEEVAALMLCTVPTVWEIRNDRNGETRKDKARDFVIAVILYAGIGVASFWMFEVPVARSLAVMLAFRILCFDYFVQWYLIRRGVIVGSWFSYNGKTARFDRLVARINPWVRFGIRVLLFAGSLIYYFT